MRLRPPIIERRCDFNCDACRYPHKDGDPWLCTRLQRPVFAHEKCHYNLGELVCAGCPNYEYGDTPGVCICIHKPRRPWQQCYYWADGMECNWCPDYSKSRYGRGFCRRLRLYRVSALCYYNTLPEKPKPKPKEKNRGNASATPKPKSKAKPAAGNPRPAL